MFAFIHLIGLLFVIPFIVLTFVFWIWMLIDAITNKALTDTEKIVWVLVILFLHFVGGVIYFLVGRPKGAAVI